MGSTKAKSPHRLTYSRMMTAINEQLGALNSTITRNYEFMKNKFNQSSKASSKASSKSRRKGGTRKRRS